MISLILFLKNRVLHAMVVYNFETTRGIITLP